MRFSSSWRGPAIFILLGGLFILISIVIAVFIVSEFSTLQRYQAGSCTITAKQLLQEVEVNSYKSNGSTHLTTTTVYKPDFQFTVQTTDNHRYPAQGYDTLGATSSDRMNQQAIVNQYTVGKTYPCWYNPADPTQAVLTRQFDWFIFFIPSVFFFIGAVFVIVGIAAMLKGL